LLEKVSIPNTSQCAFVIFEGARATPVTSHVRKHKLREFFHAGLNIQPGGKDKAGKWETSGFTQAKDSPQYLLNDVWQFSENILDHRLKTSGSWRRSQGNHLRFDPSNALRLCITFISGCRKRNVKMPKKCSQHRMNFGERFRRVFSSTIAIITTITTTSITTTTITIINATIIDNRLLLRITPIAFSSGITLVFTTTPAPRTHCF
jgi:hypothetical protein